MPGPGRALGPNVVAAVRDGEVAEADLDAAVFRLLSGLDRIGVLDVPEPAQDLKAPSAESLHLLRQAAAESMVLLSNDGVLPLSLDIADPDRRDRPARHRSVGHGRRVGAGDAVPPDHAARGALGALRHRRGDRVRAGVRSLVGTGSGGRGRAPGAGWLPGREVCRNRVRRAECRDARNVRPPHGVVRQPGAGERDRRLVHARRRRRDPRGERHVPARLGSGRGSARLFVNGELLLDGFTNPPPRGGSDFFGQVSQDLVADVVFERGEPVELIVEFVRTGDGLSGFRVGFRTADQDALLERAVAAASDADVAIVCIGTTGETESEGHDRKDLDLPGRQEELIRRVAAVNDRTVVVVNAGAPIAMSWADDVASVLQCWFGGQEMGGALADVLVGAAEPGGRLPTTIPIRLEHSPRTPTFRGRTGSFATARVCSWGTGGTSTATGRPGSRSATA
jgi:beta-glucosidase